MKNYLVTERLDWRSWVTPKLLAGKPVHRWYIFPHSFTDELAKALIAEWELGPSDTIVDPFAGAGTAVLAAKEVGIPAQGFDLSPLSVLATQVKVANYNAKRLESHWAGLKKGIRVRAADGEHKRYPDLVIDALRGKRLATLHAIRQSIAMLPASESEKRFFLLALVAMIPQFSRAVATGGWLSWRDSFSRPESIRHALTEQVELMLQDVESSNLPRSAAWSGMKADARALPCPAQSATAVISSPPYPNRHDYTRVFGVELMFAFLDWDGTRDLRYQLFHSHPEARPIRPNTEGYKEPAFVKEAIDAVAKRPEQERVVRMLRGYFLDLYLCLKEVRRILKTGGRAGFVVGNAQYHGEVVEADRATAAIGEQCGLVCEEIRLVRERGNSAQQMGQFGRFPSRESVVLFTRPARRKSGHSRFANR
jgi:tRNA G10  N-methylase Trm11